MASPSRAIVALLLANTLACAPPEPSSMGPACGNSTFTREIEIGWPDAVDLVLVVDNTEGMERAQQTLIETLPGVLHQLLSGDRDGDGIAEAPSVRSIHLGVITTDMGTGVDHLNSFEGCRTPSGDDGLLGASIRAAVAPSFLSFAPSDVRAELRAETARAIDVSTRGCVFRQPLEAALKAVTAADVRDSYSSGGWNEPLALFRNPDTGAFDAPGHASTRHAAFFRRDSLLAVIWMTNSDDCSTTDDSIYLDTPEASAQWGSDPRLRCTRAASTMQSLERYFRGIALARGDYAGFGTTAALGAIVGIPRGTEGDIALSDERMQNVETGDITNPLRDSCVSADGATHADPPRRFLELQDEIRRQISLASICSDDFTPAFRDLLAVTQGFVGTGCLPRALPRDAHGLVNCTVTETLPPLRDEDSITHCEDVPGRTFLARVTVQGEEREQCRVTQLSAPLGAGGWAYEDELSDPRILNYCGMNPQLIRFTPRGRPPTGAIVRLECALAVRSPFAGRNCRDDNSAPLCARGMNCDAAHDACNTRREPGSPPLQCDRIENLCAVRCASDADCDAAALDRHICDLRTYGEAATGEGFETLTPEQRAEVRGVCVNPSCEM